MSRAPFIVIDGKLYRWKDILELRRAQLAAAGAAQASQLALLATSSGRYLEPSLFENNVTKGEPPLSRLLTANADIATMPS